MRDAGPPRADARARDRADAGRGRARSAQAFGDRVAIQHSGLSDGERHDQWQRIRRGDDRRRRRHAVGRVRAARARRPRSSSTRSTTRRTSRRRARATTAATSPIVRGAARGRARRARLGDAVDGELPQRDDRAATSASSLERRVLDRPLAAVTRRRHARGVRGRRARTSCSAARSREAIDGAARRGASRRCVLLNRRGFATAVFCRQCAGTLECPNCSVSLVVHGEGAARRARCHYCNYSARVPGDVPAVRRRRTSSRPGFGTERVEAEVRALCPARASRGSIATPSGARARSPRCSRAFARGEIDVLVGTQMIAKGHDFPRVTLVGVVSADVGLGLADFRAAERTFQLLTQVAGRAGRGEQPGEAIIQTLYPGALQHPARVPPGLPGVLRARARSSAARCAIRRSSSLVNASSAARTFAGAMDDAADLVAAAAAGRRRPERSRVLGPGAGAARQAARRVPRAVLRQGHEPAARCARRCRPRSPRGPSSRGARSSTSIRSACSEIADCRLQIGSTAIRLNSPADLRSAICNLHRPIRSIGSIGAGVKQSDEHRRARRRASDERACGRAGRPRRTSADGAGRRRSSIATISTVQTIQLVEKKRQHDRRTPIVAERDVRSTAGRAPRTRCARRRAGRSGTG